jgi:hypothetical protein
VYIVLGKPDATPIQLADSGSGVVITAAGSGDSELAGDGTDLDGMASQICS